MNAASALPLLVFSLIFTSTVHAGAQVADSYKARLSPVPVDATNQPEITGVGSLTATLRGTTLSIMGTFSGLKTPATTAKLHVGPRGIPGPPVLDLMVSKSTAGTIQATLMLTAAQVDHLKRGRLYVQVQSEKAPDGNLRGWLLP